MKKAYTEAHESDKSNEKWRAWRETATIVLLVFTVCLTGLTYCVFKRQLDVSRDTEQRQLRAYVGESPIGGALTYDDTTGIYGARVRMINTGQTPAYGFSDLIKVMVLRYPYGSGDIFKDYPLFFDKFHRRQKQTIFPQDFVDLPGAADERITRQQLSQILVDRNQRIYVFGRIEYRDAFGAPHATYFCSSFSVQADISTVKTGEFKADAILAEHCVGLNYAD